MPRHEPEAANRATPARLDECDSLAMEIRTLLNGARCDDSILALGWVVASVFKNADPHCHDALNNLFAHAHNYGLNNAR